MDLRVLCLKLNLIILMVFFNLNGPMIPWASIYPSSDPVGQPASVYGNRSQLDSTEMLQLPLNKRYISWPTRNVWIRKPSCSQECFEMGLVTSVSFNKIHFFFCVQILPGHIILSLQRKWHIVLGNFLMQMLPHQVSARQCGPYRIIVSVLSQPAYLE